jgi:hypothetical protein
MNHPQPSSDDALRQRFRDLAESLQHVHESWREVYHRQALARQLALIDREQALHAELREVVAAFRQSLHQRLARWWPPPERTP